MRRRPPVIGMLRYDRDRRRPIARAFPALTHAARRRSALPARRFRKVKGRAALTAPQRHAIPLAVLPCRETDGPDHFVARFLPRQRPDCLQSCHGCAMRVVLPSAGLTLRPIREGGSAPCWQAFRSRFWRRFVHLHMVQSFVAVVKPRPQSRSYISRHAEISSADLFSLRRRRVGLREPSGPPLGRPLPPAPLRMRGRCSVSRLQRAQP